MDRLGVKTLKTRPRSNTPNAEVDCGFISQVARDSCANFHGRRDTR
jgi:hypothetical protein